MCANPIPNHGSWAVFAMGEGINMNIEIHPFFLVNQFKPIPNTSTIYMGVISAQKMIVSKFISNSRTDTW
jgi:hypothetical protein